MGKYQIRIPADTVPPPEDHEISAAFIIAEYFQTDVVFIKQQTNAKTADFKIGRTIWEVKSPIGNGKKTIQNNLRAADNQSAYVILDLRRIKMHATKAKNRIKFELSKATNIKQLLVIDKDGKVLEIR